MDRHPIFSEVDADVACTHHNVNLKYRMHLHSFASKRVSKAKNENKTNKTKQTNKQKQNTKQTKQDKTRQDKTRQTNTLAARFKESPKCKKEKQLYINPYVESEM